MLHESQLTSPWPITKSVAVLREQLLSQVTIDPIPHDHDDTMSKSSSPSPPNEQTTLDSNTRASVIMSTSADSDGGENNSGDGRKGYGKRELSTSKRAAQNRAAQVCLTVYGYVLGVKFSAWCRCTCFTLLPLLTGVQRYPLESFRLLFGSRRFQSTFTSAEIFRAYTLALPKLVQQFANRSPHDRGHFVNAKKVI